MTRTTTHCSDSVRCHPAHRSAWCAGRYSERTGCLVDVSAVVVRPDLKLSQRWHCCSTLEMGPGLPFSLRDMTTQPSMSWVARIWTPIALVRSIKVEGTHSCRFAAEGGWSFVLDRAALLRLVRDGSIRDQLLDPLIRRHLGCQRRFLITIHGNTSGETKVSNGAALRRAGSPTPSAAGSPPRRTNPRVRRIGSPRWNTVGLGLGARRTQAPHRPSRQIRCAVPEQPATNASATQSEDHATGS